MYDLLTAPTMGMGMGMELVVGVLAGIVINGAFLIGYAVVSRSK